MREDAFNIYVDGSSRPSPRRGGIGVRFVTVNAAGDEVTEDIPLPGYPGATNNEMELQACITALKEVERHPALGFRQAICIHSDSKYVTEHYRSAMFVWPKQQWRTNEGRPLANAQLWKELVRRIRRMQPRRIDIKWVKGHSKDVHNKAVDKAAKASALKPANEALAIVEVRRKIGSRAVQVGCVPMRGQSLLIRVIEHRYLKVQRVTKYKYEVLPDTGEFAGLVDLIHSTLDLRAGHHYEVLVNDDQGNPTIVEVVRELERTRRSTPRT